MNAIFHLHTSYSYDANINIQALIDLIVQKGIHVLSITEHNNMDSFEIAQSYIQKQGYHLRLIPAEEIATQQGEVIGLFLKQVIPKGLTLKETVAEIKRQEGVVYIPHPFDQYRSERISNKGDIMSILPDIDIVEVFNARSFQGNKQAFRFAQKHQLLSLGGPDAHFMGEVFNCVVELPHFEMNRESFLKAVTHAQIIRRKRSYTGIIKSGILKRVKKLRSFFHG